LPRLWPGWGGRDLARRPGCRGRCCATTSSTTGSPYGDRSSAGRGRGCASSPAGAAPPCLAAMVGRVASLTRAAGGCGHPVRRHSASGASRPDEPGGRGRVQHPGSVAELARASDREPGGGRRRLITGSPSIGRTTGNEVLVVFDARHRSAAEHRPGRSSRASRSATATLTRAPTTSSERSCMRRPGADCPGR